MQRNFTKGCVLRSLMAMPLLLLLSFSYAQKSVQPGRNVTLNNSNISLREVFNIIEKQTGIVLFFMDINTNQQVGVHAANTPVEEVLAEVLNPLGLTYEYVKGNREKIFIKSGGGTRVVKKDTAQVVMVSGVVTDENGEPLPGASVRVKGTQYGTATKPNGSFILANAGLDNVLQISYTGFVTQEIALSGHTNISIRLKAGDNYLNETVVTAYGTSTRRALTGAITVVKGGDIQNIPNRSVDKSLQGFVPGLWITNGSGQPGAGLSNMVIRGISTGTDALLGQTVRNPLIIVDGIPVSQDYFQLQIGSNTTPVSNPMAQLNPSDIETISVLKDASAIALYGSKASNGVILITTKRGRTGKTIFSFRHQSDFAGQLSGKTSVLNQKEYLDLLFETYRNTDPVLWTDEKIKEDLFQKFPITKNEAGETVFYPESDMKGEIFKSNAATVANEISMSGGSGNSNFYVNLEYTKQNGIVKGTDYDRKSIRFNFENRASDNIKLGLNATLSYNQQNYANALEGTGSFASMQVNSPLNPVRDANGDFLYIYPYGSTGGAYTNPIAEAQLNINRNTAYRGLIRVYTEVNFLKNFSLSSSVGADGMFTDVKEKNDPRFYSTTDFTNPPKVSALNTQRVNVITTNILKFQKNIFTDMNVNVLFGHEAQVMNEKTLSGEATGSNETLPYYNDLSSPGYIMSRIGSGSQKQTLLSLFSQANISIKNRYLLTASVRRDGASKFGNQERWGTYWSVGGGWIISNEAFLRDKIKWLNYLKGRGSIGATGNSAAIDAYTRFEQLSLVKYVNGQQAVLPVITPGNPKIRWEQTFSWDAGLESRLCDDRFGFTFDVYKKKTSGVIYIINLPSISGYNNVLANIGDMDNKGLEVSISATPIRSKMFKWTVTGNWSTNQNILVKANVSLSQINGTVLGNEEGRNFNSFYLPVWAGVNPEDGKPQWVGKDGKPTSIYNDASRAFVGKPQPDGFGALTNTFGFRGFELAAVVYYQYGAKIYDHTSAFPLLTDGAFSYANQSKFALEYWKKPGDIAPNPRRLLDNRDRGYAASTRYLYHGDYVRLQNVSLAYTFSTELIRRLRLSLLRLYVQAHNVAIITNYKGPDPDIMSSGGETKFAYPNARSFTIGLNVNF